MLVSYLDERPPWVAAILAFEILLYIGLPGFNEKFVLLANPLCGNRSVFAVLGEFLVGKTASRWGGTFPSSYYFGMFQTYTLYCNDEKRWDWF